MSSQPDIESFARSILLGSRLEDKLIEIDEAALAVPASHAPLDAVPRFPGRPDRLARVGKAEFPKLDRLKEDTARGQILHFFANHELLAMELMALVLLRFPDAPWAFRAGIARTIREEQSHMRLYIARMRELGVDFGDLPVSDYFWNAMKDMSSPLQFVTQMSLTLEQANLDYSLYYKEAVLKSGDRQTADVLERVYREEIGHVKHGLAWFNRFRDEEAGPGSAEDEWDAYLRLLPPPMTPRRAKGIGYSVESRRLAGLSERFIRELEVYGGSKGRPSVLWVFNPLCDAEIVRGKPGLSPSEPVRRRSLDLEPLLMHLASEQDVVLTEELPRPDWLRELRELGFGVPEFRKRGRSGETPREQKIGGFEPWGWSPESFEFFRPWRDRLVAIEGSNARWAAPMLGASQSFGQTGFGKFFGKDWSAGFLREWLTRHEEDREIFGNPDIAARVHRDWESAKAALAESFAQGGLLLAKAPWGTSGTGNKRFLDPSEIEGPLGGWVRNTIETQGAILLEPWLDKVADLSLQLDIRPDEIRVLGIRRFAVGSRLEYRGAYLDPRLSGLDEASLRFLHGGALERWRELARAVGCSLREGGYQGPAGIDAMLWRAPGGELRLKPLVELNPRWTMGRIALEIETRVLPGVPAHWVFVPVRELAAQGFASVTDFAGEMAERHPVKLAQAGGGTRVAEGVVFTSDPGHAREVLTILAVGARAVGDPSLSF
jgi:uncharacterized ferritin-like protein (DUF455 family)